MNAEVLTIDQAASFLQCGPKAVRRLVRLKKIKAQVIDLKGSVRIHKDVLVAFLKQESK